MFRYDYDYQHQIKSIRCHSEKKTKQTTTTNPNMLISITESQEVNLQVWYLVALGIVIIRALVCFHTVQSAKVLSHHVMSRFQFFSLSLYSVLCLQKQGFLLLFPFDLLFVAFLVSYLSPDQIGYKAQLKHWASQTKWAIKDSVSQSFEAVRLDPVTRVLFLREALKYFMTKPH